MAVTLAEVNEMMDRIYRAQLERIRRDYQRHIQQEFGYWQGPYPHKKDPNEDVQEADFSD